MQLDLTHILPIGIVIFLIGFSLKAISRAKEGKPIAHAGEQILTLAIVGGGLIAASGMFSLQGADISKGLDKVITHFAIALGVNVIGMGCKFWYTHVQGQIEHKGGTVEVDADTKHLVAELTKVLNTNQEQQNKNTQLMVDTLNGFAQTMAEKFVEQLDKTIKVLNEKLTSTLGENFVKLNEAVHKLVEWQANYKTQLEDMQRANMSTIDTLKQTVTAFNHLVEQSRTFTKVANDLGMVSGSIRSEMEELVRQGQSLEATLQSLAKVPSVATEKMNEYISTLRTGAGEQKLALQTIADELKKSVSDHQTALQTLSQDTQAKLTQMGSQVADKVIEQSTRTTNSITAHIQRNSDDISKYTRQVGDDLSGHQEAVSKAVQATTKALNDQFTGFKTATETAVNEMVNTLASNLLKTINRVFQEVDKAVNIASVAHQSAEQLKKAREQS